MMGISSIVVTLLGVLTLRGVSGFTFNTSVPTQCGEFTVQWDGGSPPYHLVIVPAETVTGGRILNISIPEDTSSPNSYTFNLNEPAGLDFLATMYDSEGWGTGGTTPVLTVGSSDNSSCISSDLSYAFFFYTDPTTPAQCETMTVTWPNNVTLPVSLYGMIPGGTAFQLPAPQSLDQTSYDWTVNVDQGTDVLLLMSDASSTQTGGSTPLLEVGAGSSGCMNDTSPRAGGNGGSGSGTATSAGPSASVSGVGGTSGGGSGQGNTGDGEGGGGGGNGGGGGGTNVGAIVGGTLGGVAFIVLLALLLICCVKRRVRDRRGSGESSLIKNYGMSPSSGQEEKRGRFDILAAAAGSRRDGGGLGRSGSDAETRVGGEEYQPSPFRYPSPPPGSEAAAAAAANRGNQPPTSFRQSKEADSRPSFESGNTGSNQTPIGATPTVTGTVTGSQTGRTDEATAGHGHGQNVQRGGSMRKSAVPPSPGVNAPRRGVDDLHGSSGGDVAQGGGGDARFVQHQDEGPVVDLPPRYDQLRPRNPDT